MIPGAANPLLLASAKAGAAYNIERSVRFNAPDSAHLSRTPSVAGNRKTWTWAGWVKRSGLGQDSRIFSAATSGSNQAGITFNTDNTIEIFDYQGTYGYRKITTQVFRDASAWYHLCLVADFDNATAEDRIRFFVNNVRVTVFSTNTNPSSGYATGLINSTIQHGLGAYTGPAALFNGYLADIHFIDGQALDPTSFGEFDANGVWQPKAYTGSYPGNSFHLPFSDNSTAAALGTDTSGNSNNWTVNNISVTAGAGNDSLVDTPTSYGTDTGAGGEVRGNYCTLNPLDRNTNFALSNGNLDGSTGTGTWRGARGTFGVKSGKWYFECIAGSADTMVGIADATTPITDPTFPGYTAYSYGYYGQGGVKYNNNVGTTYGSGYTASDVIGVAFDADNGRVFFSKNGTWQASGDPAAGTNAAFTGLTGRVFFPMLATYSTVVANFGQRPWAFTPPAGFKALCTTNLPEPQTITTSGSYTGNGVADGPFVYLNGVPTAMTVNGNAVTFGTHADKLSNGFKLRTTSTTYNQNAATYNYSVTSTGPTFKTARAQSN